MKTEKYWAMTAAALLATASLAHGQIIWDGGGGDDNVTTALNWDTDVAPVSPLTDGLDDAWTFDGVLRLTPNVDVPFTGLESITFAATAAPFTVGGADLTFGGTGTNGITNLGGFTHTVNNNLMLSGVAAVFTANNAAGATLVLGGIIDLNSQALTLMTVNAADIIQIDGTINTNGGTVSTTGPGTVQFGGGATFIFDTAGTPVTADDFTFLGPATFTATQDAELSGMLTTPGGATTFTKDGAGMLNLSGDSSGTMDPTDIISVDAGTLRVNGNIAGNVLNNAMVDGTGTIGGDLTTTAGSDTNPGNSPGILTVGGDFVHMAAATLTVELMSTNAGFPTTGAGVDYDQLVVNGPAGSDLQAGSIVDVVQLDKGYIANGDTFDVIESANGYIGSTPTITDNNPFLTFTGAVQANTTTYRLTATRTSYTADPSVTTFNRTQTALGLDGLANSTPQLSNNDQETLLAEMDSIGGTPLFGMALDYLSPERYDVINRVTRRVTQRFQETQVDYLNHRQTGIPYVNALPPYVDRGSPDYERDGALGVMFASVVEEQMMFAMMDDGDDWGDPSEWGTPRDYRTGRGDPAYTERAADGTPVPAPQPQGHTADHSRDHRHRAGYSTFTLWGTGLYIDGSEEDLPGRTGYDFESGGIMIGGDWELASDLILGVVFGYTNTDIEYRGLGGNATDDTFRGGVYLGWSPTETWNVNFALNYGFHNLDASRPIIVGVLAPRTADADWDGHEFSFYVGTDVDLAHEADLVIAPLASVQYIIFYQRDITENGAMAANLLIDDQETYSLETKVGGRFAWSWEAGEDLVIVPEGSVAWRHEALNSDDDDLGARFINAGSDFVNVRGQGDDSAFEYGAGASVLFGRDISAYARWSAVEYDDGDATVISGGVTISF